MLLIIWYINKSEPVYMRYICLLGYFYYYSNRGFSKLFIY